jgi:HEAT repeat protein
MFIQSEESAVQLLDDAQQPSRVREAAIKYLAGQATPQAIRRLTLALNDDDFGVHWEAATDLAVLGEAALPELLKALTKPDLASSPRMREGAYHVLHYNASRDVRSQAAGLMNALKGAAAAISTLTEADRWLSEIEARKHVAYPQG